MSRRCRNCKWYTDGVPDHLRKAWNNTNTGYWCTGVCNLPFPRGYIDREPPHPAFHNGRCFQWEEQDKQEQMSLNF